MDNATISRFLHFDFEGNPQWRQYVSQLDAGVPAHRVEKLKKIWYRDNVDQSFDPEQTLSHTHTGDCKHQTNPGTVYQQTSTDFIDPGVLMQGFYTAENVLKLAFILGALLRLNYTNTLGYIICFMALFRQLKRPRWTKEYGQKLFLNEFAHNIMYLFVFFFFTQYLQFLYYFPLVIHFWIGIAEYLNLTRGFIYGKLKKYVEATRQQREQLLDIKNMVEIYLLPISFVFMFVGFSNFYLTFFFGNYLRIKYFLSSVIYCSMTCQRLQKQFAAINVRYVERAKRASPRPLAFLITKMQQFCAYLTRLK